MNYSTPILFLVFNRPDTTEKVFNVIKKIKPLRLYISADGPRDSKPNEKEKCELTRKITENVDWECKVFRNYSDENLGCKKGVTKGINWFFENEEAGIILEDDVIPNDSFFTLCSELLNRYQNDNRIMHIGGTNFQDGITRGNGSYYFSRLCHVWGWATWKRAWSLYDVNISNFNADSYEKDIYNFMPIDGLRKHYKKYFELVKSNNLDTWDFQWVYTVWKNEGLSIIPNKNLVSNIGFGDEATHTKSKDDNLAHIETNEIGSIIHPPLIEYCKEADEYFYNKKIKKTIINKAAAFLKSLKK